MTVELRVRPFLRDVRRDFRRVRGTITPRVEATAIGRAMNKTRTISARTLARQKGIKVGLVRRRLKVIRPRRGSKRPRGRLVALQERILGESMGNPIATRSGARIGRQRFPGAFVAEMPGGKRIAARRVGSSRLPIRQVGVELRPEIEQVVPRALNLEGRREFVRQFEHGMRRALRRGRGAR